MEKTRNTGNILFVIFWWIVQHLNVRWAHKLLYWGLRDGSFPTGRCTDATLGIDVFGRHFDTPVGIAEGVDKRGNILDTLMQMGYSFGSFGPYTLEKELPPQDKFFFKKEKAIITQCSGYRNPGILKMLPWFVKRRYLPHFVGIDVAIPVEQEEANIKQGRHFTYQEEFTLIAQRVAPYCDFLTLDFSHPSSELSVLMVDASTITPLVRAVKDTVKQAAPIQPPKVFVKIPLDINMMEVPLVAQILLDSQVDGVVIAGPISLAKNTQVKLSGQKENQTMGMLSGGPTHEYISELIHRIYVATKGTVPIISCGGVFNGASAFDYILSGASLISLDEASLIYEGPMLIHKIDKELGELLKARNIPNIRAAVGFSVKQEIQAVSASPVQPAPIQASEQQVSSQPVENASQPQSGNSNSAPV